jgi:hypothetical protein
MKQITVMLGCILMGAVTLVGRAPATASAQHGGKAEPKRIQFKPGAISASVTDPVRGSEEAEYVVEARAGQTIYLKVVSTPRNSAVVSWLIEEGGRVIPLKSERPGRWSARLHETSDDVITVTKKHSDRTVTRYTLKVEIPSA